LNIVLDTGGLIGIERDDQRVAGLVELGRSNAPCCEPMRPILADFDDRQSSRRLGGQSWISSQ